MAGPTSIPKTMNIAPQVVNLTAFRRDLGTISSSVNKTVKDINRASANIARTGGRSINGVTQSAQLFSGAMKTVAGSFTFATKGISSFGQGIVNVGKLVENTGSIVRRMAFDLERIGRTMTTFITLPVVGAGLAIGKMGIEFERNLKKVENLVGVSADRVREWGDEILRVSPELAANAIDMSEGLFYAASGFGSFAGEGTKTMDVLTESTKLYVLGLGEIPDIARAITGAMNVYADSNLTAARAAEILLMTVREGNFQMDALAGSLGGVIGFAAELGMDFEDLGAALATLTRTTLSPAESITVIRSALLNLVSPSKQNKEILDELGYSFDSLREKIGEQGLLKTLVDLRSQLGDEGFVDFFGIRAIRGALSITGSMADDYAQIADEMGQASGKAWKDAAFAAYEYSDAVMDRLEPSLKETVDIPNKVTEAMDQLQETVGYKWDAFVSRIRNLGIGIFREYEDEIKAFIDKMSELADKVTEFVISNKNTVQLILKIVAGIAAAGPAILIASRILSTFAVGFTVLGRGIIIIGSIVRAFGLLGTTLINVARIMLGPVLNGVALLGKGFAYLGFAIGKALAQLITFVTTRVISSITSSILDMGVAAVLAGKQFLYMTTQQMASGTLAIISAVTRFGAIIASVISALVVFGGAIAGIGAALFLISGTFMVVLGAVRSFWKGVVEAFNNVGKTIDKFFTEVFFGNVEQQHEDSYSWGKGLMSEFNKGLIDGMIYIVNTLNRIGEVLASWLRPKSPPKIVPDLDDWGTDTMQVYLNGWLAADFSVLSGISDKIKGYLTAMFGGEDASQAAAGAVLKVQGALIDAINEIKQFGGVTSNTFKRISEALGPANAELNGYIKATLELAEANAEVAKAQDKINAANKKYADLLDPIQRRLNEIAGARESDEGDRRIQELERIMQDPFATGEVIQRAKWEIEEIQLKQQQAGLEAERDRELALLETQLATAQEQQALAEESLGYWEGLIDLQANQASLLEELLGATKGMKEELGKIGKALEEPNEYGDVGSIPDPQSLFDQLEDGEGETLLERVFGTSDEKLEELKGAITGLGETWGGVFTNMQEAVTTWWTESGLSTKFDNIKKYWDDNISPIFVTLGEQSDIAWEDYKAFLGELDAVLGKDISQFKTDFTDIVTQILQATPDKITSTRQAFGDFLDLLVEVAERTKVIKDNLNFEENPLGTIARLGYYFSPLGPFAVLGDMFGPALLKRVVASIKENLTLENIIKGMELLSPVGAKVDDPGLDFISQFLPDFPIDEIDWTPLEEFKNKIKEYFSYKELGPDLEEYKKGTQGIGGGLHYMAGGASNANAKLGLLIDYWKTNGLPGFEEIKTKAKEIVDDAFEPFREKIEEVEDWFRKLDTFWKDTFLQSIADLKTDLTDIYETILQDITQWFKDTILENETLNGLISDLNGLWDAMKLAFLRLAGPMSSIATLFERVRDAISKFGNKVWDIIRYVLGMGEPPEEDDTTPTSSDSDKIDSGIQATVNGIASSISSAIPTLPAISAAVQGGAPVSAPVATVPSAQVAGNNGVNLSIGPVTINNDMDMATFQAKVAYAVKHAM